MVVASRLPNEVHGLRHGSVSVIVLWEWWLHFTTYHSQPKRKLVLASSVLGIPTLYIHILVVKGPVSIYTTISMDHHGSISMVTD